MRTKFLLGMVATLLSASVCSAQAVTSFDDIDYWVGSGSNQAALVIDWNGDGSSDQSLTWGYRWDDSATGEDMFLAIVAADPRLFARVDYFGSFGLGVGGIGYDNGDGLFTLDDGTVFDADGIAIGSSDGAVATSPDDIYSEGWFAGFWHYAVATGNPFDGGSWASSNDGPTTVTLSDGAWNSWAFTPSFSFTAFAENAIAAPTPVPEPGSLLLVAVCLGGGWWVRRRQRAA